MLIREVIYGLVNKGAEFIFLETDQHNAGEIKSYLLRQRIPIRTFGWKRESVDIDVMEETGADFQAQRAAETPKSAEIRGQYGNPDLDTGVADAEYGNRPEVPATRALMGWAFYCLKTQAYWAHQALMQWDVKLVKTPRAANAPYGPGHVDLIQRRPKKRRKRKNWRY